MVPAEDGGGFHDVDAGPPIVPDGTEPGPQESIDRRQLWAFHRALKDTDLVAQRQNLQLERGAAPERGRKGGKQGRE